MARKKKIDKEMGFRLKQARTEQKLTYEELAEKSGVSSRYIKEIENHGNVPSLEKEGVNFFVSLKLEVPFSWN